MAFYVDGTLINVVFFGFVFMELFEHSFPNVLTSKCLNVIFSLGIVVFGIHFQTFEHPKVLVSFMLVIFMSVIVILF